MASFVGDVPLFFLNPAKLSSRLWVIFALRMMMLNVFKTKKAQRVASSCVRGLRKVSREVIERKSAMSRGDPAVLFFVVENAAAA